MNKLELKHIAPYLPYGLEAVEIYNGKVISDAFIVDVVNWDSGSVGGSEASLDSFELERGFKLRDIKPILRPLSDLYKPLEDGSVPIVELAEISNNLKKSADTWRVSTFEDIHGTKYKCVKNDYLLAKFYYNDYTHSFSFTANGVDITSQQLQLFDYLYLHHFDLHGLIEKGLAIDKNTIEL